MGKMLDQSGPCKDCGKYVPDVCFNKSSRGSRKSYCTICESLRGKAWYKKNRKIVLERQKSKIGPRKINAERFDVISGDGSKMKICRICMVPKPLTIEYYGLHKFTRDGFKHECRICWRNNHVIYSLGIKRNVMEYYSNGTIRCCCPGGCGETRLEFMSIDHINGGGAQQRRELDSKGGMGFYRWLIKHGYPDGYRVLCHNCNMSLGAFGYCPHTREAGLPDNGRISDIPGH